jgi:Domain of unknown function (DUF4123)
MLDVQSRLETLQVAMPTLRLYALVDGMQYQAQLSKLLQPASGLFPLFADTPDAALCHAGPWLVDAASADGSFVDELATLESEFPAMSWLISPVDLEGLSEAEKNSSSPFQQAGSAWSPKKSGRCRNFRT